jgi:predicted O-linked N-acetylglucosamine transferase (SPINDLY family)
VRTARPPVAADPHDAKLQAALQAADWPLLVRLCRQALRKNGRHLRAHRLLGFALNKQRDTDAALAAYRQGCALWPDDAELLINYSSLLIEHALHAEAGSLLEKVCAMRPREAMAWLMLAQCCYDTRQHERGFAAALKAAELAKNPAEQLAALTQKAIHRREMGQVREAVQDCEAALHLQPQDLANHTNRLLFMLADPTVSAQQLAAAAREYGAAFEPALRAQWPDFVAQRQGPWRRLKIGFLSPDLRTHSVMYFVEGLLAQLDRRQFEVWGFHLYPKDDAVTGRVRCHVDQFVHLAGLNATEQTQAIRAQGIDILFDLAGHTGYNGLLAMAHKAAPVQVSWLGYPATTGLSAIDYKFTDEVTDPPDADDLYTERLYRLPTLFCCYRPPSREPLWRYQPAYQVRPAPAVHNGFVTFGSCNNLGKLTDEVLALWGRVLSTVPNARLLIEGKNFGQPAFAQAYRERCAKLGVDVTRLELVPLDTGNQYLTYHRIDIALDPFPLTGGTTTFDLLWMGVPLVSMVGDSFKSRLSTGILTYLGRSEWLAQDADAYVRIAAALAADVPQLNTLRLGLRPEVEQSVLMREDLFNHHVGEGLRLMWLQWLAQGQHPQDPEAQGRLIESWLPSLPAGWSEPPTPGVGLAPGQRVSLAEAHQRLQALLDKAREQRPQVNNADGQISHRCWKDVTEMAERLLCAVPQDPVALACLAEVEHAHGHTEFAVTYLRYAQEALVRAAQ